MKFLLDCLTCASLVSMFLFPQAALACIGLSLFFFTLSLALRGPEVQNNIVPPAQPTYWSFWNRPYSHTGISAILNNNYHPHPGNRHGHYGDTNHHGHGGIFGSSTNHHGHGGFFGGTNQHGHGGFFSSSASTHHGHDNNWTTSHSHHGHR